MRPSAWRLLLLTGMGHSAAAAIRPGIDTTGRRHHARAAAARGDPLDRLAPESDAPGAAGDPGPARTASIAGIAGDASIGRLSGGLAHELANTGNALQLTADLIGLFLAEGEPERARGALAQLQGSCLRVLGLARSLRELAAVPEPLRPENQSRPALLQALDPALRDEADAAGARLALAGPDQAGSEDARLRCDPHSIGYLLRQLVRNAVDAGARQVELRVLVDDAGVALRVHDDGHGIAEPVRARMFAMFASSRHAQGHAGLGLWFARCLAQAQQLQLQCLRAGPGGTVFELRAAAVGAAPAR
jgi:signal transduction histidine kinase